MEDQADPGQYGAHGPIKTEYEFWDPRGFFSIFFIRADFETG
jgi:hypothetical protein